MDILTFNKITKPIYEGGASIDCSPKGKWFVEVRRTDGTIRYPFGDKWIDNVFLNQWADNQLAIWASGGTGVSWGNGGFANNAGYWSWVSLFYGATASISVGSGTTTPSQTQTALANLIRSDSSPFVTGNTISWSSTTGNIVYSIKESFPTETGSVTYNEAGIRIENVGQQINGLGSSQSKIINRVVFPSGVTLSSGEQLIITVAVTIPSLASSSGKTITIGAQNGLNISGVLKLIGSQAAMAGGSVTAAGVRTQDTSYNLLFATGQTAVALLSTKTAFDTAGTEPTWGTTNQVNGSWGTYTNGNRYVDVGFTWGNGTPASDTAFRSILIRPRSTSGALGGYQLLLDNQMTKASTATLALSLRFTV